MCGVVLSPPRPPFNSSREDHAMTAEEDARLKAYKEVADQAGLKLRDLAIALNQYGWPADAILVGMHAEIAKAVKDPKLRELMVSGGYEPVATPPDAFRKFMRDELVRFREIAKVANIKLE